MNTYALFCILFCGAYGIFMVIQGLSNYRQTSGSVETFYNADRGVNTFMLVCSTAVSVFSGLAFYGWPSSSYKLGVGYISGMGAFCVGLEFAIIGYRLWLLGKEYGFTTPVDFLRSRYYSESYGLFVAILMVAMIVPYVALQLITIGDGMNVSSMGFIPYIVPVIFSCAIICFHVFGGGMKAVAWMDTFNFILGVGTLWVLVAVLIFRNFPNGGLVEAIEIIKQDPVSFANLSAPGATGTFEVPGIINQALTASVATIVWPHIYSRCYIAKSKKNFEVMAWGLPLGYLMVFSGLILIGTVIAPAILGSGFAQADSIVPYLATYYAPPIVSSIAMLCLFAFAISTGESMLLSGTAMITKDIFIRHRYILKGEKVDDKKAVAWTRYVVVVMMIAMLVIVYFRPAAIVDYAYKLSSPYFGMVMPATIGGLFWKKGTKEGAWAGTVAGCVIVTVCTFFYKSPLPLGLSAFSWALIVNAVLYIAVSLATKCPEDIVDKYITRVTNYISAGDDMNAIVSNTILAATFRPEQLKNPEDAEKARLAATSQA